MNPAIKPKARIVPKTIPRFSSNSTRVTPNQGEQTLSVLTLDGSHPFCHDALLLDGFNCVDCVYQRLGLNGHMLVFPSALGFEGW